MNDWELEVLSAGLCCEMLEIRRSRNTLRKSPKSNGKIFKGLYENFPEEAYPRIPEQGPYETVDHGKYSSKSWVCNAPTSLIASRVPLALATVWSVAWENEPTCGQKPTNGPDCCPHFFNLYSGKVLVLGDVVDVYETDALDSAWDITVANYGRVMVVDWGDSCAHIFSEQGDHLNKFKLQGRYSPPIMAFHRASEHVLGARLVRDKDLLDLEIHTKDGEFVCSNQIHNEGIGDLQGMIVNTEGRIAIACFENVLVM